METRGLSDAQIEHYRKEGYFVVPGFFGPEALQRVDDTIQEIMEQALQSDDYSSILELEPEPVDGKTITRRIYNPFDQHQTFKEIASDDRLLDCMESLIGPNINLQHSKLNMKPPQVGSVVEWHQDLAYMPHTNDDLVTLLIYLDEATEENGCLRVLPRNHTHYFDHHTPDGIFTGMVTEDLDSGRFGKPASLPAPAGSAIFMHCIMPHSSFPNRSPHPRRTLIFEYRATDSFLINIGGNNKKIPPELYRLLRGKPSRFARFGGPRPYMPTYPEDGFASLYTLQQEAKTKMAKPEAATISPN